MMLKSYTKSCYSENKNQRQMSVSARNRTVQQHRNSHLAILF